jgi:hypothetical protein
MIKSLAFATVSALALSACGSRPFALSVPFPEQAAAAAMQPGANSIQGSGLLRQRGGGVVTCAGRPVWLMPANAYTREWISYEYEWNGDAMDGYGIKYAGTRPYVYLHPPGFSYHRKTTACDAQGNFRFDGLADGSYYVTTDVSWTVGYSPQGGVLIKHIGLSGGKKHDLVITN